MQIYCFPQLKIIDSFFSVLQAQTNKLKFKIKPLTFACRLCKTNLKCIRKHT